MKNFCRAIKLFCDMHDLTTLNWKRKQRYCLNLKVLPMMELPLSLLYLGTLQRKQPAQTEQRFHVKKYLLWRGNRIISILPVSRVEWDNQVKIVLHSMNLC